MGPQTSQLAAPPTRTSSPPSPPSHQRRGYQSIAKILVPVRYDAWLKGDIGDVLERTMQAALDPFGQVRVTRLPRAFLIEAAEEPGPLLEAVHRATLDLEAGVEATYPVIHHEMGPIWTGTLQSVFL